MILKLLLVLVAMITTGCARAADRLEGAAWNPDAEKGIRALSGADGFTTFVIRGGARCLADRPGTTPPSVYLYFDIEDARALDAHGPVYAIVSYYDETLGGALTLEYDSATGDTLGAKYRPAEERAGGFTLGTKKWKTAVFLLKRPRFANRQNCGADFRLSGTRLYVRSVRLTHARPADWAKVNTMEKGNIKPLVKIGPGGQLIVGGFDPARRTDANTQAQALEASVPALKQLGVTSHEGYVRWNLCEVAPGKFDWSVYDRFVQVYKKHGMKWVPFLIVGSAYSLPDWYYKHREAGYQGYICLEHGIESDVQSLWNPKLRQYVARFIKSFCEHYRDTGVIESILLGVTGNYGEAIYIASGNDWTADIHGPYHTHSGFWAGDKYAVESFRLWLTRKYGGFGPLRDAWGEKAGNVNAVKPFLRQDAPNERAWLDFCDWYIGSMTEWSRFWLKTTRQYFPKGDIYLCTGGHAPPEHGANFGDQCRIAAEIGGGVRITNEGSDYRGNFSLTHWVASGGRQYGAYFSFEPAGEVNTNGVIARIYNATASGAKGLHYYYPNLFQTDAARDNFIKYGAQFRQREPVVEIAAYYPQTFIKLNGNDFLPYVQPLRDRFDFDYMSDEQILDGGLKKIRALILLHGNISEEKVWRAITDWVKRGGLLFYPDGMGRLRTVEGDESPHQALFGPGANTGRGRVLTYSGLGRDAAYRAFVARELAKAPELSAESRAMVAADGEEDGLFITLCAPRELLWLNYTAKEARKGKTALPPFSTVSQGIPAR
jgi:hypothetical protein